jgi:hypothetical protein
MPAVKFAISVPREVMAEVDRAAKERRITRSRFIAEVLKRAAQAQTDAEITRELDDLFSDPAVAEEQKSTAAAFKSRRPRSGWKW